VSRWNGKAKVDWAFYHYDPKFKWEQQEWYNKSTVFNVEERGFLYGFFYKYLISDHINDLESYDWIWLMNSDVTFDDLNISVFLDILNTWQPAVAQPAITGSIWSTSGAIGGDGWTCNELCGDWTVCCDHS